MVCTVGVKRVIEKFCVAVPVYCPIPVNVMTAVPAFVLFVTTAVKWVFKVSGLSLCVTVNVGVCAEPLNVCVLVTLIVAPEISIMFKYAGHGLHGAPPRRRGIFTPVLSHSQIVEKLKVAVFHVSCALTCAAVRFAPCMVPVPVPVAITVPMTVMPFHA